MLTKLLRRIVRHEITSFNDSMIRPTPTPAPPTSELLNATHETAFTVYEISNGFLVRLGGDQTLYGSYGRVSKQLVHIDKIEQAHELYVADKANQKLGLGKYAEAQVQTSLRVFAAGGGGGGNLAGAGGQGSSGMAYVVNEPLFKVTLASDGDEETK